MSHLPQCDAIAKSGKQCQAPAPWTMPCTAVYDARCNSYSADKFKDIHLCRHHAHKDDMLRRAKEGKRLQLHHGGWFGGFNKGNFGNLVISTPTVDWDNVKSFDVPDFWKGEVQSIRPKQPAT